MKIKKRVNSRKFMRKNDLIFLKSLIEKVNPLKFRNPDGTSFIYYTRKEVYLYVLCFLHENCLSGFVDINFMLYRLYNLKPRESYLLINRFFAPMGIQEHTVLDPDFVKNKSFYRNFVRALHAMCDTTFDISQFDSAFDEFNNQLEYKKIKIKTKEDKEDE